jgi:serine/threonine protein kinase
MNLKEMVGQTLDNKYRIERELGRGGMGTVYLATHVGTERPVAVKVIAPQFMERQEFVERFRREARAAGRLRHPNVVNVTDFGLSETKLGRVAYLVMEYLDGCTLGEILEEEKKLPLAWSIDILEQISSAIEEAHRQGIIHRDLKPDNIWLEPNQRGGYTVKVLDFGIAKLEEHIAQNTEISLLNSSANTTQGFENRETVAENGEAKTFADRQNSTAISEAATIALGSDETKNSGKTGNFVEPKTLIAEAGTLIEPNNLNLEGGTAIMPAAPSLSSANQTSPPLSAEDVGTKLLSAPFATDKSFAEQTGKTASETSQSSELTRVGAVLGTPLYMSPEQCRGEHLSPRSDIYSLAVIAYQMLSGKTPFTGDFTEVMNAHKETAPPAVEAKKVPKKVRQIVHAALAKNPVERPQTVEAFASELRAQSEGIGVLLQRALVIYSQHLPKFLGLAILLYVPLIIFTILKVTVNSLYAGEAISRNTSSWLSGILSTGTAFVGILCGHFIIGTTTWIVIQILAMPLRPVKLRPALEAARKKWKTFAGTGLLSTILVFLGFLVCCVGFPILYVLFALVSSVVMMENLRGRAALKRSKTLVMRSLGTTVAAMSIMFLVPVSIYLLIGFFAATTVKSFYDTKEKITTIGQEIGQSDKTQSDEEKNKAKPEIQVMVGGENVLKTDEDNDGKPKLGGINGLIQKTASEILILPFQILTASLTSIILALLYIKTRLVGGETMQDLLAQFEDSEEPRRNWQKRIRRRRLEQTGKLTSKS